MCKVQNKRLPVIPRVSRMSLQSEVCPGACPGQSGPDTEVQPASSSPWDADTVPSPRSSDHTETRRLSHTFAWFRPFSLVPRVLVNAPRTHCGRVGGGGGGSAVKAGAI